MNYRYEEPPQNTWIWKTILFLFIAYIVITSLTSCKTKYVTVPEYHTEYVVRSDTFHTMDSVLIHDSIYTYMTGDTVIVNKVRYRDRISNVYKTRVDTLIKRDSVTVQVPVEKELTSYQKVYLAVGKYATAIIALTILVSVLSLLFWAGRKLRGK